MKYDNKEITNIVNSLSANYPCIDYDFDLRQCYTDILSYTQTNKKDPSKIHCKINNGFLFVDGMKLNKVVYKVKSYNPFNILPDNNSIDYEGLILARQEQYFD